MLEQLASLYAPLGLLSENPNGTTSQFDAHPGTCGDIRLVIGRFPTCGSARFPRDASAGVASVPGSSTAPPGFRKVERGRISSSFIRCRRAGRQPGDLAEDGVDAVVQEARTLVREHGRTLLIWLVGPSVIAWGTARGTRSRRRRCARVRGDQERDGADGATLGEAPAEVQVQAVSSFGEFARRERLSGEVSMTAEMLEEIEAESAEGARPVRRLRESVAAVQRVDRWPRCRYRGGGSRARGMRLLLGGSVVPEARGRGVYQALTFARRSRRRRGRAASTIQAGRMSRQIVEHLGFELIDTIRVYVDDVSSL